MANPPYAILNYNIWIDGWLSDPVLHVYTPVDDTVVIQLLDDSFNAVSDTLSQSVTAGRTDITLGDFLDAQQSTYGFGDGYYVLAVKFQSQNVVLTLPIFIAMAGVTPLNDDGYLHTIYLLDKHTGIGIKLPASMNVVPSSDRYLYFLYYYKDGKGRLVTVDKTMVKQYDTGYHKYVVMKFRLRFDSLEAMLYFMLSKAFNIPNNVFDSIYDAIASGDTDSAVKLLTPFVSIGIPDLVLSVDVDTDNYEIVIKARAYLGWFEWFDNFARGFVIGCAAGAAGGALIGSIVPGLGTATGAIVGCLAGGAALGYIEVSKSGTSPLDTSDPEITAVVPPDRSQEWQHELEVNKQKNQEHYDNAVSVLDDWKSQGKITQDDYDRMKQILDQWKATVDEVLDEYYNELIQAWKDGYNNGYSKGKQVSWLDRLISGATGAVVGYIIGKI